MENNEIKIYNPISSNNLNILLLKSSNYDDLILTCVEENYSVYHAQTTNSAITQLKLTNFNIVIAALGTKNTGNWDTLIKEVRAHDKKIFIIIFSWTASNSPQTRYNCFTAEVSMVTDCLKSVKHVLKQINDITTTKQGKGNLTCPYCEFSGLSEDALWTHLPLYHVNISNTVKFSTCPQCLKKPSPNMQVHYRNLHGPCSRGEVVSEFAHDAVELYAFSLVIVYNKSITNKRMNMKETTKEIVSAIAGFGIIGGIVFLATLQFLAYGA